jgi:hypothetical protein
VEEDHDAGEIGLAQSLAFFNGGNIHLGLQVVVQIVILTTKELSSIFNNVLSCIVASL